jgi:hypothetical protein
MSAIPKAQRSGEATVVAAARKRDMTRVETAQYISDHFFPCSPRTLAKLAVIGGGPPFRKAGRVPLYGEASTDAWAESKIGPLVHSTTELAVSVGEELVGEKTVEMDAGIASRYAENGSSIRDSEHGGKRLPEISSRRRVVSRGGR